MNDRFSACHAASLGLALVMGCLATSSCSDGGPDIRSETTSTTRNRTTATTTTTIRRQGVIAPGETGSFEFDEDAYAPLKDQPLTVWYDAPAADALASAKVLIVMHGQQRNGEEYRDDWIPHARGAGALLIVPEFSEQFYPDADSYNVGNIVTEDGDAVPESKWSLSAIEPLFDFVQAETGNLSDGYYLFGHSAGAQFVHRFMLLKSDNRVKRAVSANAGWYTAPEPDVDFPYGLRNSPSSEAGLRRALAAPLTVLLGEEDVDTDSESLRSTPEADRQGPNRLARGRFFFRKGQEAAEERAAPFGWELETVAGATHSNAEMAPTAARILFE